MKGAVQKSRIPEGKAYVIQELIAPFFDINWHFHVEYQLFVVLKGRGTRFIGDHMQSFKEGDMVLTGPNLPHLWKNDKAYHDASNDLNTHGIVIYFHDNFLNDSVFQLEEFERIAKILKASHAGILIEGATKLEIQARMKKLVNLKGTAGIISLLQILELIAQSEDCQIITKAGYLNNFKESEKDRMGKVYEYVIQNYHEKASLKEAAQLANLSVSAFSRYFKSRVNQSFSNFLTEVRISQASKLLHETDLNISEVAYECGFFTLSNFNRLFKQRMTLTPLEYRRDFKEKRF